VLTLARRFLGSREAAEDLLQDVFVKVHGSLAGFRGESSLKTWIARITVNAARNRRRDDARRLRVVAPVAGLASAGDDDPPSLDEMARDGAPSPERRALSSAARVRIEDALARLPADFREALVLRESEGLSYDEIARATGVEVGTVKSRIARARARLQEELRDLVGGGWP
jgi:RNA polymerase sigma-70 factor (ECF subfamily)